MMMTLVSHSIYSITEKVEWTVTERREVTILLYGQEMKTGKKTHQEEPLKISERAEVFKSTDRLINYCKRNAEKIR